MTVRNHRYVAYRRYRSRVIVVGVVIATLAVGGVAFVRVERSHGKPIVAKSSDVTGPPRSTVVSFTDLRSKMGIATGAQLWQSSLPDIDQEIADVAATGARWLRTSVHWKDVEPSSASQDDWSKADHTVSDARAAGLSVIFTLGGAPDWAGAAQAGEFGSDPAEYGAFAAKVAARYRGSVSAYELGNEPNHVNYVTHPDAATYTQILRAAYQGIKAADPAAFVLTGGLGGTRDRKGNIDGAAFAAELYQAGAKGFFDGIAYHPYTYPQLASTEATTGGRGWSRMLQVRETMVQNGDGAKSIWITEFGAPTQGPDSVSESQQAAILHDAFDLWETYPWGGVMNWFSYHDKGTDTTTHKDWFGLVDSSGRHKPAYAAYAGLLPPATSHYTADEIAAVDRAAQTLGVDRAEEQRIGSAALAWVLGVAHTGPITPVPDDGNIPLTTDRQPPEYSATSSAAATQRTTVPEFQKTGALALAYVLAAVGSASRPTVP
jgi:hypothetical protein